MLLVLVVKGLKVELALVAVVMAWYFRHDYSARNDRKIAELEMEMGDHVGYAMWFKLLEIMGEMGGSLSKDKLKVAAYSMRVPLDMLTQFIRICVRIELLEENGNEYVNARFVFTFPTETYQTQDGPKPHKVSVTHTMSLSSKGNLLPFLQAWR